MDVVEGDLEVLCWFFMKPYTSMYLLRGGTHWTRTLEFRTRNKMTVHNPKIARFRNLKMFAVPQKDRLWHYLTVPAF